MKVPVVMIKILPLLLLLLMLMLAPSFQPRLYCAAAAEPRVREANGTPILTVSDDGRKRSGAKVGDKDSARYGDEKAVRKLQSLVGEASATPIQTYIIPIREEPLPESFNIIRFVETPPYAITSASSIAATVLGTVIWYDHWEDGYETDVARPTQPTTEVWGDGDWTNGCVERIRAHMDGNDAYVCSSADADIVRGGEALVLENDVPTGLLRDPSTLYWDGGDSIHASFPVAMTRAAYPQPLKSVLAGAVEMIEAKLLGSDYTAPVGIDTYTAQGAFSSTEVWIMATEDGTIVWQNGVEIGTIDRGQELVARDVLTNDAFTSNKPVQANLVTGEKSSYHELRWFSLMTTSKWFNDYYTPVHRTEDAPNAKQHRVVMYNPGPDEITIEHYERDTAGGGGVYVNGTFTLPPGSTAFSNDLGYKTGSRFLTTDPSHTFYALMVADFNVSHGGNVDWGHPLIPANRLTSQALVGLGWGCTDNACGSHPPRSAVWVTAAVDADIYVDYDGDGLADEGPIFMNSLDAVTLYDLADKDMSGATIWATKPGVPGDNSDVYIAVAWGQDPYISWTVDNVEDISLDMGTAIMPLPELSVSKYVEHAPGGDLDGDGSYSAGDILRYTIRLTNAGHVNIPQGSILIVDDAAPLFDQTTYILGSTTYTYMDQSGIVQPTINVADDAAPDSPFPLDDSGLESQAILYMFSVHHISFDVEITKAAVSDFVNNVGRILHNGIVKDTFSAEAGPVSYSPSIDIQTTVYPDAGGGSCPGVETYTGVVNTPVTYCYVITNTGDTYLNLLSLSDDIGSDLSSEINGQTLAPGDSLVLSSPDALMTDETNVGVITANPALADGQDLPDLSDVTASDPANVVVSLSASPTSNPTLAPAVAPVTDAPTTAAPATPSPEGVYNLSGDLCKYFDVTFAEAKALEQFAFIAHTTECVRATVYVSELPLTTEEIDACCKGTLGEHWTQLCEAFVVGMGDRALTMIDEADCDEYLVTTVGTELYFHVSMEIVDEAAYCLSPAASASYDEVAAVRKVENAHCNAVP